MNLTEQSVSTLVKEDIRMANFFQNEKIDFCCNGHRNLGEVLKEKGIDEEVFLESFNDYKASLDGNGEKENFYNQMDNEDLINYIRSTHHTYTRQALKELDQYVAAIVKAHYRHDKALLLSINSLYGKLRTELHEHLVKEEVDLFPLIMNEQYEEAKKEIEITESEHDAAGTLLAELRKVTNDYTLPSWACTTFKAVYHNLESLESDLFRHIFLENSILFERF